MPTPSPDSLAPNTEDKLPNWVVVSILAISGIPALLMLFGVDLSTQHSGFDFVALDKLPKHLATDSVFESLHGAFSHVFLEWSAVGAAAMAFVLCIANWTVNKDSLLPIIGIALLAAGSLDAFHTLAATRMIEASADNNQLIPFTWAIARAFDLIITTAGIAICLTGMRIGAAASKRLVWSSALAFFGLAYAIIHICATSPNLPQTQFPDALLTRPWDAFPLIGWILAAYYVFRPYHKQANNSFSHSLLIAIIPQMATEAHMAFGSSALFDAHFNAAHFLKIVAYATPVVGLLVVYIRTLWGQRAQLAALGEADVLLRDERDSLALANVQLAARNAELDEFAYVASHDLQEPLRKMTAYSDLLVMDIGGDLNEDATQDLKFITEAAGRMSILIGDILALSRENSSEANLTPINLEDVVQAALDNLESVIKEKSADIRVAALPSIFGDSRALTQILQNLISNGIKYCKDRAPEIQIAAEVQGNFIVLSIDDNGIGIPEEHQHEVFAPFKRLHGRAEYEGTGIGLAICRKSVMRLGGEIWIEPKEGPGTRFLFSIPRSRCASKASCAEAGAPDCESQNQCPIMRTEKDQKV